MNEPIRQEDLRCVMSALAQTVYGTRLIDANFTGGVSLTPKVPTLGNVDPIRVGAGPRPFTGAGEWNRGDKERFIGYDSGLPLAFDLNSWLFGWFAAFFLGDITSSQEGATGHYSHECHPTDPNAAAGVRDALITSIYLDAFGLDATRFRRVLPDLAIADGTISGGTLDLVQIALNLVGSGRETVDPTITLPALTSVIDLSGQDVTIEYGTKGGALTDISDRIESWSLRFNQGLDAGKGYFPSSGLYRGRMRFVTRNFSVELAIKSDRANRDLYADTLALTRKELKFTLTSSTLCGTSAVYHGGYVRFPDVRISEAPLNFADDGAAWGVRVAENQVYQDAAVAASPVTIQVENVTPYYLAAP